MKKFRDWDPVYIIAAFVIDPKAFQVAKDYGKPAAEKCFDTDKRLLENDCSWSEEPGLLEVKKFTSSKHSLKVTLNPFQPSFGNKKQVT